MPKVLIVDDEKSLLSSLETGLEEYKDRFEVLLAQNGKEAVKVIGSNQIDLLITDLKMPIMNGFELLAHVFSNFPHITCVVMTAFNTPEIEEQLSKTAMMKLIEKPIDIDAMINIIINNLEKREKGSGLPGISLSNYLQLLSMEGRTCVIEVQGKKSKARGFFYFIKGQLYDATYKKVLGEGAVSEMLQLEDPKILLKDLNSKNNIKKRIKNSLMAILLESAKDLDEQQAKSTDFEFDNDYLQLIDSIDPEVEKLILSDNAEKENKTNNKKGEGKMAKTEATMEAVLEKFTAVGGFLAAGAFSPAGEVMAELNASGIKLGEIGALANDVLLKAQKATEIMEVGRGQMVHIEAPKAHIIARCLNEAGNFKTSESGKAHIHMVIVIKGDGNLAMAKMRLESIITDLAPFFR